MVSWSFLTKHARVLPCIARDRGTRLRDIEASLNVTERSAHGIVNDLAYAGYVVKQKDGHRNRYKIQAHPATPRGWPQRPGHRGKSSPSSPARNPLAAEQPGQVTMAPAAQRPQVSRFCLR